MKKIAILLSIFLLSCSSTPKIDYEARHKQQCRMIMNQIKIVMAKDIQLAKQMLYKVADKCIVFNKDDLSSLIYENNDIIKGI